MAIENDSFSLISLVVIGVSVIAYATQLPTMLLSLHTLTQEEFASAYLLLYSGPTGV